MAKPFFLYNKHSYLWGKQDVCVWVGGQEEGAAPLGRTCRETFPCPHQREAKASGQWQHSQWRQYAATPKGGQYSPAIQIFSCPCSQGVDKRTRAEREGWLLLIEPLSPLCSLFFR
jgi:hypothetical protein